MHIHFLTYSATMRKMEKKGGETEGMEMEAEKGKERPEKNRSRARIFHFSRW